MTVEEILRLGVFNIVEIMVLNLITRSLFGELNSVIADVNCCFRVYRPWPCLRVSLIQYDRQRNSFIVWLLCRKAKMS